VQVGEAFGLAADALDDFGADQRLVIFDRHELVVGPTRRLQLHIRFRPLASSSSLKSKVLPPHPRIQSARGLVMAQPGPGFVDLHQCCR
jgi:hypothetical protein